MTSTPGTPAPPPGSTREQLSAGASATARAERLRREARGGLWRRLLAALGLDWRGDARRAVAGRWEAGAVGEQRTAHLLQTLAGEGWCWFDDRALPGTRANADHVLVAPCGRVINVDSKLWSARYRVHAGPGGAGLWHGTVDRTRSLSAVVHESECIRRVLGVPVATVVVVHGAPVAGGGFTAGGVRVVPADGLLAVLRSLAGWPDPVRAGVVAGRVAAGLPRYGERGGVVG